MRSPGDDDLYLMLLIRRFEEELLRLFGQGLIDGTTHTCIGQEYVPVALAPLLRDGDHLFSNHRGHGHYLARFRDPVPLLAEITGREGGVCRGVGGSQHLRRGTYLSSGVQGESVPVAVGAALHLRREGGGALALAYVGDGTFGEGAVYEALNMARLWEVPLVLAVENNHIAQTTPLRHHLAGSVRGRAEAFDAAYRLVTSRDVMEIRGELKPCLRRVRDGGGPLVVEFDTVRLGPHSKGDDTRDADEVRALRERDWLAAYSRHFPGRVEAADAAARATVEAAVHEVLAREPARWAAVPC
ncbi:thiamine pyrophosphate-dependent dehydrogenase E1 component subunit alpha [Microbispora sp. NBC_01189]|uniref:thiamine pyrophosphate-dependent dehydrogenase E1 component subunit alpha n=1 Tax=Microbispora sp. NBC_01189 TaxID=2903583 RepID=UPI002E14416A|nr:thiamine pyrophosphate-dependent dehydrogenase E1 component subunit alpha [Microbispora sp. NBC_01189]